MNRRKFTKLTGASILLPMTGFKGSEHYKKEDISALVENLIKLNDTRMPANLERQELDPSHTWYGGIANDSEIFYAGHAAGFIRSLTCSYVSPKSKYYRSPQLISSMILASEFLLNAQYDDGNIDLPSTNFHSPPDTAFTVEPLCIAYSLLSDLNTDETGVLLEKLKRFLVQSAKALTVGGIHTANHRWVVCMALARLNKLFPDLSYMERTDQWLAERIDIDPDGQYAERSTLIYTPLVNRCLITIARLNNKPELFDPVRKNLDMTMFYIHPNGEIATESSGRQDKYQRGTMENYLYAYRYIAILDQNQEFSSIAGDIQSLPPEKLMFWLSYFLEDPFLSKPMPLAAAVPVNYVKEFYHSDLVRIRQGNMDATILAMNPIFLTFFKGNAAIEGIRMASAFFGKGQFKGNEINKSEDSVVMSQRLIGPYYQPLSKEDIPEEGNGWQVSRMKRDQTEVQEQVTEVIVTQKGKSIELSIRITGTENVPITLELAFRHGGVFEGVEAVKGIPNACLATEDKMMTYTFGEETITFGPGLRQHAWTQLRGALTKLDADCVYFTGFAPLQVTLEIQ